MVNLDYMVLADYVRSDSGVMHIMGAGIDTIYAQTVPTTHAVGVALRMRFETTEAPGSSHTLSLIFQGSDQVLATANAEFLTPSRMPNTPIHWQTGANVALSIALPLPAYGDYSFDLLIDDVPKKSIELRVVPPPQMS